MRAHGLGARIRDSVSAPVNRTIDPMSKSFARLFVSSALCVMLAACAGDRPTTSTSSQPAATGGRYKVGQPYQIKGEWYYPREDYSYDESGIASWYGDDFHNKLTANGEVYNKNELTAAHKTLPLPSLARVTNLENGRSVVVRINDRGPFSGARLIDVSQRSAQLLGFEQQGTAKVRVQVLADESKAIADAMRTYGAPSAETPAPVQTVSASPQAVETQTLAPVRTTPETHQQLIATRPVAEAVQLPVTTGHGIYVQAGAFSVAENANRLKQSLSGVGNASVSSALVNGTTFYRVRLGPVQTVREADALLAKVRRAGVASARTIVD